MILYISHKHHYTGGHSIIKVDKFAGPTRDWRESTYENQHEYDARMRREKEERIRRIEGLNQPKPKRTKTNTSPFNPVLRDYYRRSES